MTTVLLVGTGAVGVRAARQLVDTPGLERVLIAGRHHGRRDGLVRALGERAAATDYEPGSALPAGVDVVATAVPARIDPVVARAAVESGVAFASCGDDHETIRALIDLDPAARERGVTLVPGAGLAPGLSELLAHHAADSLDSIDEVHVARAGVAGAACVASVRRARRDRPLEWRDGVWHHERGSAELIWFPDPVGAHECEPAAGGAELILGAFPHLERATFRLAEPPSRRSWLGRRRTEAWGATRVVVWGWRGAARAPIVYGVVDRTAVAAGTMLAVAAAGLAGVIPSVAPRPGAVGVHGPGSLFDPAPMLAELERRGVKAATFDGVGVG